MGTRVEYAYNLSQLATMPIWRDGDLRHVHSMLNEAQAIAEEQNVPHLKAHVLAEMITVQLVEGRYQEALTMTEEVMVMAHQGLSTWIWAAFQRGIAYLGLGRIEEAIEAIKLPLSRMIEEDWSGLLRTLIAFPAVILAERGQEEWAAELLAHGLTHPTTIGRLEVDPLIIRHRHKLEASLGDEALTAAWERGSQLDTLTAAAEVLAQLKSYS
jgi:tetratricopeptide (TPR) repeat protein